MTTNRDWLFSLPLEEQYAWMNAEHQERALDVDTEPESEDSRERLEVDIRKYANPEGNTGTLGACWERKMLEFIDRQAAITEEKTRYKWVTASAEEIAAWRSKAEKLKEQVYELTAERDELKELNEYHALQYELASEDADRLQAQVDRLTAERDDWKEHSRTIEYRCKKAETDCGIYRKKFGKCLDYADAIHALMDDEGMA